MYVCKTPQAQAILQYIIIYNVRAHANNILYIFMYFHTFTSLSCNKIHEMYYYLRFIYAPV